MQTVADIERPLKERIAALEAERDDIDARLRELYDEYTNRQEGWNSERDALTAENERLKVEINRLETALEFCRDGDKTPETGDYKTPKQVATAALAGHKTVMQQRWEWQGAAIQEAKQRADAAEQEADKWRARCANAVFLIPDSVLCGDIRKEADSFMAELMAVKARSDAAEAEVARLTDCLRKANSNMEECERDLYMDINALEQRADAAEAKLAAVRDWIDKEAMPRYVELLEAAGINPSTSVLVEQAKELLK